MTKVKKEKTRVVKRGVAKDYQRGAKLFDYYYITVNNKGYTIMANGWDRGLPIQRDAKGRFVVVENENYYLDTTTIDKIV